MTITMLKFVLFARSLGLACIYSLSVSHVGYRLAVAMTLKIAVSMGVHSIGISKGKGRVMNDKDKEIAGFIVGAIKAGYKVTFERNDIGAVKNGNHIHLGFIDELVAEVGNSPFDYINQQLIKGEAE